MKILNRTNALFPNEAIVEKEEKLEIRYIPLDVAMLWDRNPNQHDIGTLITSIRKYGFKDPPKFEPELNGGRGGFVEGNGRTKSLDAMRSQDPDKVPRGIVVVDGAWCMPVLFGVDAESEAVAEAYGVDHNAIVLSGGDFDFGDHKRLWKPHFDDFLIDMADTGEIPVAYGPATIDMLQASKDLDTDEIDRQEIGREKEHYVPDLLFASSNDWEVPDLQLGLQARGIEMPLTRWGKIARSSKMLGTYHFYTDDYKFRALWKDPRNLVNSGCAVIVEPNFSTNDNMPLAVGLWGIYRKRWLARYAQSVGIRVFVDLNVSPKFRELNQLGVPEGWMAFATRALSSYSDRIVEDYEIARGYSEDPLFVVYGGGKDVERLCQKEGWLHLKEDIEQEKEAAESG